MQRLLIIIFQLFKLGIIFKAANIFSYEWLVI